MVKIPLVDYRRQGFFRVGDNLYCFVFMVIDEFNCESELFRCMTKGCLGTVTVWNQSRKFELSQCHTVEQCVMAHDKAMEFFTHTSMDGSSSFNVGKLSFASDSLMETTVWHKSDHTTINDLDETQLSNATPLMSTASSGFSMEETHLPGTSSAETTTHQNSDSTIIINEVDEVLVPNTAFLVSLPTDSDSFDILANGSALFTEDEANAGCKSTLVDVEVGADSLMNNTVTDESSSKIAWPNESFGGQTGAGSVVQDSFASSLSKASNFESDESSWKETTTGRVFGEWTFIEPRFQEVSMSGIDGQVEPSWLLE